MPLHKLLEELLLFRDVLKGSSVNQRLEAWIYEFHGGGTWRGHVESIVGTILKRSGHEKRYTKQVGSIVSTRVKPNAKAKRSERATVTSSVD